MLTVRDATLGDLETIVAFNCRLAEESEGRSLDRSVLRRGVSRALEDRGRSRYFVAEHSGALVGQAMVTYEWSDWRDGVLWWFQSVYVRPEHRRRGVFRALFDYVAQSGRDDPDVRGLRLYVERNNTPAIKTYERMGMRPSGHLVYEVDWSGAVQTRG